MNATLTSDFLLQYIENAQREIAFCHNCQPVEHGKRVWRFGIPVKMPELLAKLKIPPTDFEYIAESLECNHCGALLDIEATVGLQSQNERELERRWRKWETQYANRFRDLHDFLMEYPSLSLQHRLGRELFKALADLPRIEIGMGIYFCARKVTSSAPPTLESFNPPVCGASEGQFHNAGQVAFALADSETAAAREILTAEESVAWVQKYQLARGKGLLDLSRHLDDSPSSLIEHLVYGLSYRGAPQSGAHFASDETIFRVPRFIADCARMHGFNGIRTKSRKHFDNHLILFSWPAEALEVLGTPFLLDLRNARTFNK